MKIKFAKLMSAVAASRRGATAIEYGVIAALVSLVVAAGAATIGDGLSTKIGKVSTCVTSADPANNC